MQSLRLPLCAMDDPQKAYPCIHVAGSDGKGSTCSIMASILRASGLKVGLYTSPHIMEFRERITVDGETVSTFHDTVVLSEPLVFNSAILKEE